MGVKKNNRFRDFLKKGYFKYLIVIVFFIIWMFFFDKNNVFQQTELRNELDSLINDSLRLKNKWENAKLYNTQLMQDINEIEKVARENYYVKRDNEDVYLFITKEDKK